MTKSGLDKLGAAISIGCAVHCVLTPIILPALPMLGFVFGHESHFHLILSGAIVMIAGLALVPGYLKHKANDPLVYAAIGLCAIVGAGIAEHFTDDIIITAITIVGSIYIIIGHYLNHKYKCSCVHHRVCGSNK